MIVFKLMWGLSPEAGTSECLEGACFVIVLLRSPAPSRPLFDDVYILTLVSRALHRRVFSCFCVSAWMFFPPLALVVFRPRVRFISLCIVFFIVTGDYFLGCCAVSVFCSWVFGWTAGAGFKAMCALSTVLCSTALAP